MQTKLGPIELPPTSVPGYKSGSHDYLPGFESLLEWLWNSGKQVTFTETREYPGEGVQRVKSQSALNIDASVPRELVCATFLDCECVPPLTSCLDDFSQQFHHIDLISC